MTDATIEKLIQKVANFIEEVNDLNILVRRIPPASETVNKIHERLDAIYTVFEEVGKKLNLDDSRLRQLEEQTKALKHEQETRSGSLSEAMVKFNNSVNTLNNNMTNLKQTSEVVLQELIERDQTRYFWLKLLLITFACATFFLIIRLSTGG